MKSLLTPRKPSVTVKPVPSVSRTSPHKCGSQQIDTLQARDRHPAEEDLEEFLFGRLSERQRKNIEIHLHDCNSCRESLVALADIIGLLRAAMGMHELCASWPASWNRQRG
jgi:hypothetical protein